jgi:hypothetical protein
MPDGRTLQQFLTEVEEVFAKVLEDRENLLPADLHDAFLEAWPEVRSRISRTRHDLTTIASVEERLPEAGLTGKQLDLKLAGFGRALESLRRKWGRKLLKPVLKWANILLGSLAAVLPGAELIKEYKESLENAAEEMEE